MKPKILDTTLRDGSYAVDFGMTADYTATMCAALERVGIPLIEIGHGIGLGASRRGLGEAAESDRGYMEAAARTLTRADWGMFCIPGVGELDDIELAADMGMDFVRIGTDIADVRDAEPFVKLGRQRGLFVAMNFMKSYVASPEKFADLACRAQGYGAEMVYIVDSAGGMLADELSAYVDAVRRVSGVALGFHGHNNLGLAVSNTLRAVELGAEYIDTSLQGLGRSAGNAPTEQVVSALLRMGFDLDIELIDLIDAGNEHVRPMIARNGHDPIDTVSGFALFHSSYMGIIREYSEKYAVDPRRLIIALCEVEKAHAPRALVEKLARKIKLQQQERVEVSKFELDHYVGAEQENEIRPGSEQPERADTAPATGNDVEPPFGRVVRGRG